MVQSRLFSLLLMPSFMSGLLTIIAAVVIIGVTNWPYFTYNDTFYTILYGDFGAITALEKTPSLTLGIEEMFGKSPIFYAVVITLASVIASLIVFLVVRGARKSIGSIVSLGNGNTRNGILQTVGLRMAIVTIWAVYILLSVKVIIPLSLFYSRIGAEILPAAEGAAMALGSLALCIVCLHLHVVLLRLLILRPRVFGGAAAIEEAAFYHRK